MNGEWCSNSACKNRATKCFCDPARCKGGVNCKNLRWGLYPQLVARYKSKIKIEKVLEIGSYGGFATGSLSSGEFIIEYAGVYYSNVDALNEAVRKKKASPGYAFEVDGNTYIDGSKKGNYARFLNHSCKPNCEVELYKDERGRSRLGVFAKVAITPGDELTFEYAGNIKQDFKCQCWVCTSRDHCYRSADVYLEYRTGECQTLMQQIPAAHSVEQAYQIFNDITECLDDLMGEYPEKVIHIKVSHNCVSCLACHRPFIKMWLLQLLL